MKKKLLPVLTVFCLVVLVLAAGVITFLIKKYTPSGEMMDGDSYFQIQKNDEAALIVNRTVEEEKVKIIDSRYYVEDTVVGKYIILGISAVLIFSVNTNFLIWSAFAACMVIFVFPLFFSFTITFASP